MPTPEGPIGSSQRSDAASPVARELAELRESHRSLRALFQIVLVSLLILTGSVFLFLLREVSVTRRQVGELTQYVAAHEKNNVPIMRLFRDRLIEFARTNEDFVPILSKYVNPTNYLNPGVGAAPSRSTGGVYPAQPPVVPPDGR